MFKGFGASLSLGSRSTRRLVSLGGGLEELPRGCAVSDRCALLESEYDGQVERAGTVGERFVELTVDAQGFQGGGLPFCPAVAGRK